MKCTKEKEHSIHYDCEGNRKNGNDPHQVRCSRNHHWLTKKTIADVVEALLGAYIVDSGFKATMAFLRWFGLPVEFEVSQVFHAWTASSKFISLADHVSIPDIEGVLGHTFAHKGLILEAFVHASYNRHGGGCYQVKLRLICTQIVIILYKFSYWQDLSGIHFCMLNRDWNFSVMLCWIT